MTTATKTLVQPTWTPTQVQETTARMAASTCFAAQQTLAKHGGEEAFAEYQTAVRRSRIEYLKTLGIKGAIDLAQAIAEQDTNLFGSKIEISGDEKSATLTYLSCGMWNAMKSLDKLTTEQEAKMGEGFQSCMHATAGEFGLKANVQFEGTTCTVGFSK
jgi:hypothetical protein